jgi:hypothetical protein
MTDACSRHRGGCHTSTGPHYRPENGVDFKIDWPTKRRSWFGFDSDLTCIRQDSYTQTVPAAIVVDVFCVLLLRPVDGSGSDSLCSSSGPHFVPRATSISVVILLLTFWVSLIHWSVVLWCSRKPNWLAFSASIFSVYFHFSLSSRPILGPTSLIRNGHQEHFPRE